MKVTLIHNPGAGEGADADARPPSARIIEAAGHAVTCVSYADPDWPDALRAPGDLVAVEGGDGTIGRVAKRMIGRGIPLAALAGGTANNIAMTLGTASIATAEQVRGWTGGRRIAFDAFVARGPFGTRHLIEGLGVGLFPWAMCATDGQDAREAEEPQARIAHALSMLGERVTAHPPTRVQMMLDGNDLSGDYVALEAMNTQFIGPNLFLAPGGHPGDGLIDVVTVSGDARVEFRELLDSWKRGALQAHAWPARRGRHLALRWTGYPLHLDDDAWPGEDDPAPSGPMDIDIEVEHAAIEFLVPHDHAHPPLA